ncbi:MAG: tetratricopeptide repeat protein, partial [Chloroflexota bacterium]
GLRFIVELWNFWKFSGYQHQGRQIAQTVLEQTVHLRRPIRAQVLRLAGWLAHDLRDYTTMLWAFQSGLELSEELTDQAGIGLAHQGLGELAQLRGQWDQAEVHIQHCMALFRQMSDQRQTAWCFDLKGRIALSQGKLSEAQTNFQESLDMFRSLGSRSAAAFVISHLGQALFYQGEIDLSGSLFEEGLRLSQVTGDVRGPVVAITQNYLAEISIHKNQLALAREQVDKCRALCKEVGYTWCAELGAYTAGLLAIEENDFLSAGKYFQESLLLQQSLKEHWRSIALLEIVSTLSVLRRQWLAAARLYSASAHLRSSLNVLELPIYRPLHEKSLQELREHLKTETLGEAWIAGQTLSLNQAITYAIRCLE